MNGWAANAFSTADLRTMWVVKVISSAVAMETVPPAARSFASPSASSGSMAAVTAAISTGVNACSTLMKPSRLNAARSAPLRRRSGAVRSSQRKPALNGCSFGSAGKGVSFPHARLPGRRLDVHRRTTSGFASLSELLSAASAVV